MVLRRHFYLALCSLLLCTALASYGVADLAKHRLPAQDFKGWSAVPHYDAHDTLSQIWRQTLTDTPKGVQAEVLFAYQVTAADTAREAERQARALLEKKQFDGYIARGYTVATTPWVVCGQSAMQFTVRGLSHDKENLSAQRAEVYLLAFSSDTWIIRAELRQVCKAQELSDADRGCKSEHGMVLAEALMTKVLRLWSRDVKPETTTDSASQKDPAKNSSPKDAADTPLQNPAKDPTPKDPTGEPNTVTTTAKDPPKDTSQPVTAPKPEPTVPNWQTADGRLAFHLPDGWKVAGKGPWLITGLEQGAVRLYPAETYADDKELSRALDEFTSAQKEISSSKFLSHSCTIDGGTGVDVHYLNTNKQMMHLWYFGKAGCLWRLDVVLPEVNTAVPSGISSMLATIHLK